MKTVAVVGISNNPDRPSYQVGMYLKNVGFQIIPVNPNITEFAGIKANSSIVDIPKEIVIDIVDIFRQPNLVIPIIDQVVQTHQKPLIWMQDGVGSPEAENYAKKLGFEVVSNRCMMRDGIRPEKL